MENIRLAIFVSGGGTNCENIIRHFQGNEHVSIPIVVSSSADAYAITRAHNLGVATTVITRKQLNEEPDRVFAATEGCDYIILAGFLPKVPEYLIERFPNRIINIHPALLPKFGGKGMWGHHVHEAVKAAGETESGITIHYVNAELDQGEHIAQYSTPLSPDDTAEDIADKVHVLEMKYFPNVIEKVIFGRK
ncbi:MAG: phosphoribosylglycinamide formyltransferase [Prevotella sp.]|nr:phosphoribosylglycinamide formyltransferase [Prevotella sp.]MCI7257591.1 phosphoribosylglycinamide formyltransferase [Prevotella sp.]